MHITRILEQSEANVMFNRPAPSRGGGPTYEEGGWDIRYRKIEIDGNTHGQNVYFRVKQREGDAQQASTLERGQTHLRGTGLGSYIYRER